MAKHCYSEIECKIIQDQIERRAKFRQEFLKQRTDPCKHAQEAGYVFDEAIQRFISMKDTQLHRFSPGVSQVIIGILTLVPIVGYGYLLYNHREKYEHAYRCGLIRYRDRMFKLK